MKALNPQDALNAFREQVSTPRNASCPSCGAALVYVEGRLSVYEIDQGVTICLGFCEQCDELPITAGLIQ